MGGTSNSYQPHSCAAKVHRQGGARIGLARPSAAPCCPGTLSGAPLTWQEQPRKVPKFVSQAAHRAIAKLPGWRRPWLRMLLAEAMSACFPHTWQAGMPACMHGLVGSGSCCACFVAGRQAVACTDTDPVGHLRLVSACAVYQTVANACPRAYRHHGIADCSLLAKSKIVAPNLARTCWSLVEVHQHIANCEMY